MSLDLLVTNLSKSTANVQNRWPQKANQIIEDLAQIAVEQIVFRGNESDTLQETELLKNLQDEIQASSAQGEGTEFFSLPSNDRLIKGFHLCLCEFVLSFVLQLEGGVGLTSHVGSLEENFKRFASIAVDTATFDSLENNDGLSQSSFNPAKAIQAALEAVAFALRKGNPHHQHAEHDHKRQEKGASSSTLLSLPEAGGGSPGWGIPWLDDIEWRVDYKLRSSVSQSVREPVFQVAFCTSQYDQTGFLEARQKKSVTCSQAQLEDLVQKLADAKHQAEVLMQTNENL